MDPDPDPNFSWDPDPDPVKVWIRRIRIRIQYAYIQGKRVGMAVSTRTKKQKYMMTCSSLDIPCFCPFIGLSGDSVTTVEFSAFLLGSGCQNDLGIYY